jgi:YD repeat-containing protein
MEREIKRPQAFEAAGREAQYENARDAFLTKKYGELWYMYDGDGYMSEEFDSWLDRKREEEQSASL